MRDEIIKYASGLKVRGFSVSQELPFDSNGNPLYIKNPKKMYVGPDQTTVEPLIQVFNGRNINREVVTVSVYVATDAKQSTQETSTLITGMSDVTSIDADNKYSRRTSSVTTEFLNELSVTTIELTFDRITT